MVREGRVFTTPPPGDPQYGVGYYVTALEVGAQVAEASSGTDITVRAGHGFAAGDKLIVGTDTTLYREVDSVTATTVKVNSALPVSEGDLLVNLGADLGATEPAFTSPGLTIYTDMDYSNAAVNNTVLTDQYGRYRYYYKGVARWELVRSSSATPIAIYQDVDDVPDSVRYAHLYATGGSGTSEDPWVGWSGVIAANSVCRFIAGTFDITTQVDISVSNVVVEGYGDATILTTSTGLVDWFDVLAGADHVTFRNFFIQGNQPTATGGRGIDTSGDYTVIENVTFDKVPDASIASFNNTGLMVRNCRSTAQGDTGTADQYFVLLSNSTWATIVGNITDGTESSYLVSGVPSGGWIFVAGDSHDAVISNNIINNVENGVRTSYTAKGVVISGNRISNVTTDAIRCHSPVSSVTGNTILDPGHNGIATDGGVSGTWTGNSITGAGNKGIYVFNSGNATNGLVVSGNYVIDSADDGIRVATNGYASANINVIGNVVKDSGSAGINVSDAGLGAAALSSVRVSGNIISGSTYAGISITPGTASSWDDIVITGNTSIDNGTWGLLVSNGTAASTITVNDNTYSGNTTGTQSLSSTNWTYGAMLATGITVSGVTSLAGGIPRNIGTWTINSATAGTDTACTNGTAYTGSIFVPANMTITGVQYLVGSVGGTDKVIASLHNSTGTLLANSALAGATVGTAAQLQQVAFTATYAAVGPAWYHLALTFNGTTAKFRTIPAYCNAGSGVVGNGVVQTFGTAATFTAPTTFTADKVPVASLY